MEKCYATDLTDAEWNVLELAAAAAANSIFTFLLLSCIRLTSYV